MRLTPLDIRKQEFTRGFRGYDPEEVNAFLQMVSSQWDEILDDSRRKDEKIRELINKMEHYEKVEEALQEALQTARESSRQAVQNAEDKARLIVDQAERRAEDIKRDAEQDRHQIKRETAKLSGRRSEIVSRLRAFLMSEMELLARFEGDDPVGFIKLLPAEERRRPRLPTEPGEEERLEDHSSPRTVPAESHRTTTFAPRPVAARADEHEDVGAEESSSDLDDLESYDESETARESGEEVYDDSHDEESPYDQEEYASPEAARHRPEQNPHEEVMHGPGWTARTVISRPSEQTSSRHDKPPEYEEAEDEETTTRSSSDEIEKIRRILSDLD